MPKEEKINKNNTWGGGGRMSGNKTKIKYFNWFHYQ